jgi:hypothetical protein
MSASGLVVRVWNDAPISRRDSDGYVNATSMCQAGGKDWFDYIRLNRTQAYIAALTASLGSPENPGDLIQTTTTGPNHLRGTWIHPRLAVDLARWISPAFAVWMDGWFLEWSQALVPLDPEPPRISDPIAQLALEIAQRSLQIAERFSPPQPVASKRRRPPINATHQTACAECGTVFHARHHLATYCSGACRQRACRERKALSIGRAA